MALHPVRTLGITIDRPFPEAYGFAARPENFRLWAAGLADSLHQEGGDWIAQTPEGRATVRFTQANAYGVLDHVVSLPERPDIVIPFRMIPNGDGTEVLFTLFRQPGMTDEQFEADAQAVERDLKTLKTLLEESAR